MRPTCKKTITVRGKEIGGRYPLACLPLVAADLSGLLGQAREILNKDPDLIEWRIDGFAAAADSAAVLTALASLRETIGDVPLILTCRASHEGGMQDVPLEIRIELLTRMLQTGLTDMVDFEISNGDAAVARVVEAVQKYKGKLILSFHDFHKTSDSGFIFAKLAEAGRLGADVAKFAAMPNSYQDVLDLLGATLKARNEALDIPIITMSMGEIGRISRIAGALFGSDVSFAIGQETSAPGQIPVADLRQVWKTLAF